MNSTLKLEHRLLENKLSNMYEQKIIHDDNVGVRITHNYVDPEYESLRLKYLENLFQNDMIRCTNYKDQNYPYTHHVKFTRYIITSYSRSPIINQQAFDEEFKEYIYLKKLNVDHMIIETIILRA